MNTITCQTVTTALTGRNVSPGSAPAFRLLTTRLDFQVTTSNLTGVDFELGNSYAGNIKVQRSGHSNNTLFFWGFEHKSGSLTAAQGQNDSQPWAIWLQGGYDDLFLTNESRF